MVFVRCCRCNAYFAIHLTIGDGPFLCKPCAS